MYPIGRTTGFMTIDFNVRRLSSGGPPKKAKQPRAKKVNKESADKEEKPKSSRGEKRKVEDEAPNGDAGDTAAKKVRFFF